MHGEFRAYRAGRKSRARDERTYYSPRHPASSERIHLSNQIRKTTGYQNCRRHPAAGIVRIRKPAAGGISLVGLSDGAAEALDFSGGDEVQQAFFRTNYR